MTAPAGGVRWGVLGAGDAANAFATGLAHVPGSTVTAVASRTRPKADALASRFGAIVYPDVTALLDDRERIDAVYVATPNHRHHLDCLAAVERGIPVLCEKPFAVDAAAARAVVGLARERRVFCMEAMWTRFVPATQRALGIARDGTIGEPRALHATFGIPTSPAAAPHLFVRDGGGALLDRGVYGVSLAIALFGVPTSVHGVLDGDPGGPDLQAAAILTFAGGEQALVQASLTAASGTSAVIAGTTGRLTIGPPFYCPDSLLLEHHRERRPAPTTTGPAAPGAVDRLRRRALDSRAVRRLKPYLRRPTRIGVPLAGNGYGYEAAEVARCLREGLTESPVMPLDHTLATLDALDAARGG